MLFPVNMPPMHEEGALAAHAVQEVKDLANHFSDLLHRMGCDDDMLIPEWAALTVKLSRMPAQMSAEDKFARIFNDPLQHKKLQNIMMLVEIILVIPVSSAVCERGFPV